MVLCKCPKCSKYFFDDASEELDVSPEHLLSLKLMGMYEVRWPCKPCLRVSHEAKELAKT
jgi:hypothetical protein